MPSTGANRSSSCRASTISSVHPPSASGDFRCARRVEPVRRLPRVLLGRRTLRALGEEQATAAVPERVGGGFAPVVVLPLWDRRAHERPWCWRRCHGSRTDPDHHASVDCSGLHQLIVRCTGGSRSRGGLDRRAGVPPGGRRAPATTGPKDRAPRCGHGAAHALSVGEGSVEASGDGRRAFRVGPLTAAFLSALWFRRNRGRTRAISRRGARARLRGGSDGRGRGALNGTFCQRLTRSGVFCSARLPASVSTAGTRSSGLPG